MVLRDAFKYQSYTNLVSVKNKLVKICDGFSRIDSVSKRECTGVHD